MINRYFLLLFFVVPAHLSCMGHAFQDLAKPKLTRIWGPTHLPSNHSLDWKLTEMFVDNPGVIAKNVVSPHIVFVCTTDNKVCMESREDIEASTIFKRALAVVKDKGYVVNCGMTKRQFRHLMPYLKIAAHMEALSALVAEAQNLDMKALFEAQLQEAQEKQKSTIDLYSFKKWKQFLKMTTCLRINSLRKLAVEVGQEKKYIRYAPKPLILSILSQMFDKE